MLRERREHARVVAAALHGERALRRRRHEALRVEAQHDDVVERAAEALLGLQALDAGRREHDRVEAAFLEPAHARRHVAAQRLDAQILAKMREPHAAARRGRADARAGLQRQPIAGRSRAGNARRGARAEIGGIDARRVRPRS